MSGLSNGIKVIKCQDGPQPKKITARARSQNLKQHFEGFLSVNMTDQNAANADTIINKVRPTIETLETIDEKNKVFYKRLMTIYKFGNYIEKSKLLDIIKEVNELYPRMVSPETMCEIVAILLGYRNYEELERSSILGCYGIKVKLTLEDFIKKVRLRASGL